MVYRYRVVEIGENDAFKNDEEALKQSVIENDVELPTGEVIMGSFKIVESPDPDLITSVIFIEVTLEAL